MSNRLLATVLVTLIAASSCTASDDASVVSVEPEPVATDEPETAPATAAEAGDVGEFCEVFADVGGEQPESYVGSEQHVSDIERLLAVAPPEVSGDLEMFRDFVASGSIDTTEDPASNETTSWPDEVQAAVSQLQAFGAENC